MKGGRGHFKPKNFRKDFEKKERVVDLFRSKRSKGDEEHFSFNKAPVLESSLFSSEKKNAKKKIKKPTKSRERRATQVEDYEGGSDEDYFQTKKMKFEDADDPFDEFEGGLFEASNKDFLEYFQSNQSNLKALNKMSSFKFSQGSVIIAAVSDFGPMGKYISLNLSRNRRAYVSYTDIIPEESNKPGNNPVYKFQVGEFVIGYVLASTPKKVQLTLNPKFINSDLEYESIQKNQILPGIIASKEDYGYQIEFGMQDGTIGFLPIEEFQEKVAFNRPYLFLVKEKETSGKILKVEKVNSGAERKPLTVSEDNDGTLEGCVKAGNVVRCIVKKKLQNGLLVSFLKMFLGFIFEDQLTKPLHEIAVNEKFTAVVVATNYQMKEIHLSMRDFHMKLERYEPQVELGALLSNIKIAQVLYGGSYLAECVNPATNEEFFAFLHKTNLDTEDLYEADQEVNSQFAVKYFNYFDHLPVLTGKEGEMNDENIHWQNLKAGDHIKGTIEKITTSEKTKLPKLLIKVSPIIKGTVDYFNLADKPSKATFKHLKEGSQVHVRILEVNTRKKKLKLTLKPIFVSSNASELLFSYSEAERGQGCQGYITGAREKGYIVKFFGGTTGFLPFSDIEGTHNMVRTDFLTGQTLKVYVARVDAENRKLILSLSKDAALSKKNETASHHKAIPAFNEADPKDLIGLNSEFEYKILQKASTKLDDLLVLKARSKKYAHYAVVYKEHLSDFADHYDELYKHWTTSESKQFVTGKVIAFLPQNNVLVTLKTSLVKQNTPATANDLTPKVPYFGYVVSHVSSGLLVKINDDIKALVPKGSIQNLQSESLEKEFPRGKTIKIDLRKIDYEEDKTKISFNLSSIHDTISDNSFLNFLEEEYTISQTKIEQNVKTWNHFKIGNYVKGTVSSIKEYGVLVTLEHEIMGLIFAGNLTRDKETVKEGEHVLCRILDIDYNQGIVDLLEENVPNKKWGAKTKEKNYNLKKIAKYGVAKSKAQNITGEILLIKDLYLVVRLEKYLKVLALVSCKGFNEHQPSHEKYHLRNKIRFSLINSSNLEQKEPEQASVKKYDYTIVGAISEKKTKREKTGMSEEHNPAGLAVGTLIEGKVQKITANNIFVALSKGWFGRLHKTQIDYDWESGVSKASDYQLGEDISSKIVYVRQEEHLYIELSNRQEQLSLAEKEIDEDNLIVSEVSDRHVGKQHLALIKSVNKTSLHPIYVELSNYVFAHLDAFSGIYPPSEAEMLNEIGDNFQEGTIIPVYLNSYKSKSKGDEKKYEVEVSLFKNGSSSQKPELGDLVICRVVRQLKTGVRVQLSKSDFGLVDITELFDEWYAEPTLKLAVGTYKTARIIAIKENGEYELSLRSSVISQDNWKVLTPEAPTIKFKKVLGHEADQCDLRSRIYKLGSSTLQKDMLFIGYVQDIKDKGCFIKLSSKLTARANLKEISEFESKLPQHSVSVGQLVMGRIIGIREDGKVDVTLKESGVIYGYDFDDSKMKVGTKVVGRVVGATKTSALVSIIGTKKKGTLKPEELGLKNEGGSNWRSRVPLGLEVKAVIVAVNRETKHTRIKLSISAYEDNTEETKEGEVFDPQNDAKKKEEIERSKMYWESVKEINRERLTNQENSEINTNLIEQLRKEEEEQQAAQKNRLLDLAHNEDMEVENGVNEENQMEEEKEDNEVEDGEGEEDDENEQEKEQNEDEIVEEQSVISDTDMKDNYDELVNLQLSTQSKNKKKREANKMKLEEEIRKREQRLLEESAGELKTNDDYEKLILRNPNSSYVWIQFVAFKLENEGIEKARQLIERALRVINFRNETEKLNAWVAYLNLEFNFGKEDTLMKIFERALAANSPKKIYMKMIEIYKKKNKYEMVEELSKTMLKKFKRSSKTWIAHMQHVYWLRKRTNQPNGDVKDIVQRALQSLPKRKHVRILTEHSMLFYKNQEPEKGRTVFEAIVMNYPKRTDIWSIYIDMEIKFGTKLSVRELLERAITLPLGPKKIKFFFKRYITYEQQNGNEERVEAVKQKAIAYVESHESKNDNQMEEEAENNENRVDMMDEEDDQE